MDYSVQALEVTLVVPSIEETTAWYERVLGWTGHLDTFDAQGRCLFGSVSHRDVEKKLHGEEQFKGLNLNRAAEDVQAAGNPHFRVMVHVDDVDRVYAQVIKNGGAPDAAPEHQFWGGRTFTLRDLNGFNLMFVQMVEQVSLEEARRRHRVMSQ